MWEGVVAAFFFVAVVFAAVVLRTAVFFVAVFRAAVVFVAAVFRAAVFVVAAVFRTAVFFVAAVFRTAVFLTAAFLAAVSAAVFVRAVTPSSFVLSARRAQDLQVTNPRRSVPTANRIGLAPPASATTARSPQRDARTIAEGSHDQDIPVLRELGSVLAPHASSKRRSITSARRCPAIEPAA